MSSLSLVVLMVIALTCYSVSSAGSKLQHKEQHQLANKLNSPEQLHTGDTFPRSGEVTPRKSSSQKQKHSLTDRGESRRKRSQLIDRADFKEFNDNFNDVDDGLPPATGHDSYDLDNMPPLKYYMLLQRIRQLQSNEPVYRVRTPRLGRSIDFQQLFDAGGVGGNDGGDEDINMPRQFVSHMLKKSVPFKPRLGKRGQMCDRLTTE